MLKKIKKLLFPEKPKAAPTIHAVHIKDAKVYVEVDFPVSDKDLERLLSQIQIKIPNAFGGGELTVMDSTIIAVEASKKRVIH